MKIFRTTMILMLAAAIALLSACGKPAQDNGGEEPFPGFTEAQRERIAELAELFSVFGPCDIEEGLPVSRIEALIPCHWADKLPEAELTGYGRVTVEEADEFVDSVLKGVKLNDFSRTDYDPTVEQDCFVLNGYYYIKLSGRELSAKIVSIETLEIEDGETKPVRAVADVYDGEELVTRVTLRLRPDGADGFYILKAELGDYSI